MEDNGYGLEALIRKNVTPEVTTDWATGEEHSPAMPGRARSLEEYRAAAALLGMHYSVSTNCFYDGGAWWDADIMEQVSYEDRLNRLAEYRSWREEGAA